MSTVIATCLAALGLSAVLCLVRIVRGDSLADRIVALDTLLIIIVIGITVNAARTGSGTFVDVVLVAALIAFIGTVTVARHIERRGAR